MACSTSHRLLAAITCLIAAALPCAPALAQGAVVLPAGGDAGELDRTDAVRGVEDALRAQGLTVRSASGSAPVGGTVCRDVDCASELLSEASEDLAVAAAVWNVNAAAASPRSQSVFVTIVDRRGLRYPASAKVVRGDVAGAARAALHEARALQLLGPAPWIHVRSTPAGAEILLDGVAVGRAPLRLAVTPGTHALELRYPSLVTQRTNVEVPHQMVEPLTIDVRLQSESDEARSRASTAPDVQRPIVGPALLGGAGLTLIGIAVVALASEGCDRKEPSGACTERTDMKTGITLGYAGLGVAALTSAVIWYVLGEGERPPVATPSSGRAASRSSLRRP